METGSASGDSADFDAGSLAAVGAGSALVGDADDAELAPLAVEDVAGDAGLETTDPSGVESRVEWCRFLGVGVALAEGVGSLPLLVADAAVEPVSFEAPGSVLPVVSAPDSVADSAADASLRGCLPDRRDGAVVVEPADDEADEGSLPADWSAVSG